MVKPVGLYWRPALTQFRRHFYAGMCDRLQVPQPVVHIVVAVLVGLASGVGVWIFKLMIELAQRLAFGTLGGWLGQYGSWTVALIPIIGGLLVGVFLRFFIGEERYHGVAGIMEAVALAGGRLRYRRIPAKSAASALSIGFGASVGPEDPSVQIGSNIGSMTGQVLRLSEERVRALVAAGAAGGIAAAFNAPITGVFFAVEIILGEISGSGLGTVVLASVASAVFIQAVSGPQPAFRVPEYTFVSPWELPFYIVLGVLAGIIAAVYIRALYQAQDIFHAWAAPRWLKPAAAGLIVGVVGIFLPQIFGAGYSTIEGILNGASYSVGLLCALLVAKLILTPVSIAGGFLGGVFAPSLFLGATLGSAFGQVVARLIPAVPTEPAAFALVGMAAVLAGAVHAPITAILLLFEMTNDYRIILPLMAAVIISLVIAQRLQPESVYSLALARKGIRLDRGRDIEVLEALTVVEVMAPPMGVFHETDTLETAADVFSHTRTHGLPVLDAAGSLVGILTVSDLDRAQAQNLQTVGDGCSRDLLVAFPDESLATAFRRMGQRDIGRLPVVAREDPHHLLGVLRRTDLLRAYDAALTRRAVTRHRSDQVRLGTMSGLGVQEFRVAAGAPCAGKRILEVRWPAECVVASVRRGRRVLVPHGDTVLQSGDVLVVVADQQASAEVRRLCQTPVMTDTVR